jgi:hypothetical protein
MAGEVYNVNVHLSSGGTPTVGTSNIFAFWVPTDALGGGITITRVAYASNIAIGAGSAPNYTLVSLGTDSATNGTIATAIGSAAFTAGTPRVGTVASAFVDGAYGVAIQWAQTAVSADYPVLNASIQYVMGK